LWDPCGVFHHKQSVELPEHSNPNLH
jgi:hypothetical protein